MSSPTSSFADLGLRADLCARVAALGFTAPTPVQAAAIPVLLAGEDLLGQAATGTGKTAAFGLPLVAAASAAAEAAKRGRGRLPLALVLVPTRELAVQVGNALTSFAEGTGLRVATVTGGAPMMQQRRAMQDGTDLLVATPGRLLDHLRRGSVDPSQVAHLVLDEADEMLDMGFAEDLESILNTLPSGRQTALLSATLPPRIAALARRHLDKPKIISLGGAKEAAAKAAHMRQWAHGIERQHKFAALVRVLRAHTPASCIVFCRTRQDVDGLRHALRGSQVEAAPLHGGMDQNERDNVMRGFRAGDVAVLVATDVAARGLDVEHVSHVINFDLPTNSETYLHRIGRTGRAGREGCAISLVERAQARTMVRFARELKLAIAWQPLPTGEDMQQQQQANLQATFERLAEQPLAPRWEASSQALVEAHSPHVLAQMVVTLATAGGGDGDGGEQDAPPRDIPSFDPTVGGGRGAPVGMGGPRRPSDCAQLFVGLGRREGMQPRDVVDCMREVGRVDARSIGRIDMGPNFSLVEVPAASLAGIVDAMRGLQVDGREVIVRADRRPPARR